jgi:anaerobic sulfite reductase subunit B
MTANAYRSERVVITAIVRHTPLDFSYRLAGAMPLRSGQFLAVSLPGIGEAPLSVSDFGADFMELTLRKLGRLTSALQALRVGDSLWVRGPYGNGFPVDAFDGRHLIVAAGGTGVAPVKSLIERYCADATRLRRLDVLLGFRSPSDILFAADIARWSERRSVLLTVDRADAAWQGKTGLITQYVPEIAVPDPAQTDVVIVGPPAMMSFTSQAFLKRGIPEDHVWLSFERNMHCGVGKCGHCKILDRYVCIDGPVFTYSEAKRLID